MFSKKRKEKKRGKRKHIRGETMIRKKGVQRIENESVNIITTVKQTAD